MTLLNGLAPSPSGGWRPRQSRSRARSARFIKKGAWNGNRLGMAEKLLSGQLLADAGSDRNDRFYARLSCRGGTGGFAFPGTAAAPDGGSPSPIAARSPGRVCLNRRRQHECLADDCLPERNGCEHSTVAAGNGARDGAGACSRSSDGPDYLARTNSHAASDGTGHIAPDAAGLLPPHPLGNQRLDSGGYHSSAVHSANSHRASIQFRHLPGPIAP